MFYQSQSGRVHFIPAERGLFHESQTKTLCLKFIESKAPQVTDFKPSMLCQSCLKKLLSDPVLVAALELL